MAWTYEQKFNSLTDGDLNGQDSWSGGTAVDVQTAVTYEGAKAIKEINGNTNMFRDVTAVTSGTLYIAGRMEAGFADGANFDMLSASGATLQTRLSLDGAGNITASHGGGASIIVTGYSVDTWYLFEIVFTGSTFSIRYNTTGLPSGWSASFGPYNYIAGAADLDRIRLNLGGSQTSYWDTITPTNPIVAATTTTYPAGRLLMGVGM